MRTLIKEPFLFTGLGLINLCKRTGKHIEIYDGDIKIMHWYLRAGESLMSTDNIFNVMKFTDPIKVTRLNIKAGRKWEATINKNDKEYLRFNSNQR